MAADWVGNGWYHAGLGYGETHVAAGSSTVMSYHVTAANGVTAAGVTVKFIMAKTYSGSNAKVNVGSVTATGTQAIATGVTDANGDVSFTLVNTDSTISGKVFTQTDAFVVDSNMDTVDIIDVIFDGAPAPSETATASATPTATASATPTATSPSGPSAVKITLDSTDLAGPGSAVGNGWYHGNAPANNYVQYVTAGQTFTLSYLVKDAATDTAVGAGTIVTLSVAKSGAGVANFTGSLSATTDADGIATFTLTNTNDDATAESYRADLTSWSDATGAEYKADFTPAVSGATATVADLVWTHTVSGSAPAVPDVVANIYLTSADRAGMSDKSYWWTDNAASRSLVKFVTAGDDLVLHYVVTYANGSPIANTLVTLTAANVGAGANFDGELTGTTDSHGAVTFTLMNTDSADSVEPHPVAPSNMIWWDDSRGATLSSVSEKDFTPSISREIANVQRVDRVWAHIVQPVPNAATDVVATRGNASATISWTAPEGGDDVTGYTITYSTGGVNKTATAAADATSKVITGLVNGTEYTVSVVANGAYGDSDASNSATVTPATTAAKAPAAPVLDAPLLGNRTMTIGYVLGSDNGATITRVEYSIDNGATWTETMNSPIQLTGLTNGKLTTVRVRAINSVGAGKYAKVSGKTIFADNMIDFMAPSAMTFGDEDQMLDAMADGGTTVFASTTKSVCTIVDGAIHIVKPGSCKIKATNAGNAEYKAAAPVKRTVVIAKASNVIHITSEVLAEASSTLAAGSYDIAATNTAGTTVKIKATPTSTCTYSAATGKLTIKKTTSQCTVTFSSAASTKYSAATPIVRTVN